MMMLDLLQQFSSTGLLGVIPNPTPEQPPGTDGISTVINWVTWICLIGGVLGFLGSAGYLAIASWTGREVQGVKGLAIAIIACILITAAGANLAVFI